MRTNRRTSRRPVRRPVRRLSTRARSAGHGHAAQLGAGTLMAVALFGFGMAAFHAEAGSATGAGPTVPTLPQPSPASPETTSAPPAAPEVSKADDSHSAPTGPAQLPAGYEYLNTVGGVPVLANACVPIVYTFDASGAPAGGAEIVADAVAQAAMMTGLDLTTASGSPEATHIVIAFRDEAADGGLAGSAIGVAHTRSTSDLSGAHVSEARISLETEWFTDSIYSQPDLATMVVLHEIGHGLGLAHVFDDSSIMYPSAGVSTLSAADYAAFSALDAGCPISRPNTGTNAASEILTTIPMTIEAVDRR